MLLRFSAEFELQLSLWQQAQLLRPLDVALLRALPQAANVPEPLLLYLMLASSQLAQGHLCLDLQSAAAEPLQLFGIIAAIFAIVTFKISDIITLTVKQRQVNKTF